LLALEVVIDPAPYVGHGPLKAVKFSVGLMMTMMLMKKEK